MKKTLEENNKAKSRNEFGEKKNETKSFLDNLNQALQSDMNDFDQFYWKYDDSALYSDLKFPKMEEKQHELEVSQNQTETNILTQLQPVSDLRSKFQEKKNQAKLPPSDHFNQTLQLKSESTFVPYEENEKAPTPEGERGGEEELNHQEKQYQKNAYLRDQLIEDEFVGGEGN